MEQIEKERNLTIGLSKNSLVMTGIETKVRRRNFLGRQTMRIEKKPKQKSYVMRRYV